MGGKREDMGVKGSDDEEKAEEKEKERKVVLKGNNSVRK